MHDHDRPVPHLQRRQLLWQGVVGAGALTLGPRALRALGAAVPATDLSSAATIAAVVVAPPIVTREQWGADESLRRASPDFAPVNRAIVHHTVTATNEPDPAGRIRAIQEFHVRGNGWADIGYNFVVDSAGRVYEGRFARNYGPGELHDGEDGSGREVIGAHALGHNAGSVGIAILGNYADGGVTPTEATLEAVVAVVAWKLGSRSIDPGAAGALIGHRDVVSTGCPGDGLYQRLPELRDRARARAVAATTANPSSDGGGLLGGLLDTLGGLLGG
ncbi:MAG: N-acetylmuramoyl-L-alanine amidase [Acidimicrobiales bacterium]